jgi:hypothetical protein
MIRTGLLDHVQLPAAQSLSSSYTLAGRSLATGRTERYIFFFFFFFFLFFSR